MLCLEAWFGKRWFGDSVRDQQIKVWAKIGGKFLGFLERPSLSSKAQTKQDVVSALCSLQAKVASWLPHPQRGPKHLLVFDGLIQLTPLEFAYNTQSLDAQVVARHLGAAKDLHVLWNEDDSYAERVLDKQKLRVKLNQACLEVTCYGSDFDVQPVMFPAELEAYNWKGKPIERLTMRCKAHRLGDVSMFPVLRQLSSTELLYVMKDEDYDKLAQCKHLVNLEIFFSGGLSNKIGLLKGLTTLKVYNCDGRYPIPSEIKLLDNLTSLDLQGSGFRGRIPTELGKLSKLKHLCIYHTKCDSCIPSEFGNLQNLKTLDLANNKNLHGNLPSTLSKLFLLTKLDLSDSVNVIIDDTMERGVWKGRVWTSE